MQSIASPAVLNALLSDILKNAVPFSTLQRYYVRTIARTGLID
jgi:hypothetical protein